MSPIKRRAKQASDVLDPASMNIDNQDNNQRVLLTLCVDCSSSMEGEPIKRLNAALLELRNTLRDDIELSGKAMVCVISFGDGGSSPGAATARCARVRARWSRRAISSPRRSRPAGDADGRGGGARDDADRREKRRLRARSLGLYRPVFWCIGDGCPTDDTGHYCDDWRRLRR